MLRIHSVVRIAIESKWNVGEFHRAWRAVLKLISKRWGSSFGDWMIIVLYFPSMKVGCALPNKILGVLPLKWCIGASLLRDAMLVWYMLSSCVRLSVCPSICPSHAAIMSKRLNIGSCKHFHMISLDCSFLIPKVWAKFKWCQMQVHGIG